MLIFLCSGSNAVDFTCQMLPTFLVEGDPKAFRFDPKRAIASAFNETEEAFADSVGMEEDSGACACIVLFRGRDLWAANVGDCRAVVIRESGTTKQLTLDHRASVKSEKARVLKAGGSVKNGRVFGILMPSRTVGDLHLKPSKSDRPPVRHALPSGVFCTVSHSRSHCACTCLLSGGYC